MKRLIIYCSIAFLLFAAGSVLACGGGDKDKDKTAFTTDAQTLCGGSGADKDKEKTKT